jgi:hypothetical protein
MEQDHPLYSNLRDLIKGGGHDADIQEDGSILVTQGVSYCGHYDQPNRKFGYTVAYNRAVKNFQAFLRTLEDLLKLKKESPTRPEPPASEYI